jgi:hypothetical protein
MLYRFANPIANARNQALALGHSSDMVEHSRDARVSHAGLRNFVKGRGCQQARKNARLIGSTRTSCAQD